eukprot:CAMPEP_0169184248 /NCGR_PEP_ID=MMETSP1016-20121227/1119_1 /TAXON_ID=342587 /ORGANISM="Karlodinium micrum, Strain CCMP2283" /LENGTH=161 /DNA_ID=CAMNT_0009259787 /DNA_START=1011 /DNA_END=1493 /DNA_ORIENTATION=-
MPDPTFVAISNVANTKPETSDQMPQAHDEEQQLSDVREDDDLVRTKSLRNETQHFLHPRQSEQPDHSYNTERTCHFGQSAIRDPNQRPNKNLCPINSDNEKIEPEPCSQVAPRDLCLRHLDGTIIRHKTCDEGHAHVQRPENAGYPLEKRLRSAFWKVEKL